MTTVTEQDRDSARSLLDALHRGARIATADGAQFEIPAGVAAALSDVLEATADGDDAVVVRNPGEVTTEQAAEVLGVSRPTVVRLVDAGRLPGRMVGTHRRIQLRDVLAYRERSATRRRAALDRMADDAEELGLYET